MDIKLPTFVNLPLPTTNLAAASGLELKLNQLIPAKIIETQILLNTLSVQVGDKTLALQAERPLPVAPGQPIELQVSKLMPAAEFKLVSPPPAAGEPQPRLTLIVKANSDSTNTASVNITNATNSTTEVSNEQNAEGQRFFARVLSVTPQKITLLPMPAELPGQNPQPEQPPSSTAAIATVISRPESAPSPTQTAAQTTATPEPTSTRTLTPPTPQSATSTLMSTSTYASKPLVLDLKQLVIAAADLPKLQSSAPQNNATNPLRGEAADNRSVYLPINKIAGELLKPQMAIELQLLNKSPLPTFVIQLPQHDSPISLTEIRKQFLPIQLPLQPLLQHFQQLAAPATRETGTAGEILQHLARSILRDLPPKTALMQPVALKQWVENSGLFMESKLLRHLKQPALQPEALPLQDDLKFKLSKVAETVKHLLDMPKPNPEEPATVELEILKQTLSKTQGTLAKITLEQLNSLPKDDGNKQNWIIELPFFNPPATDSVLLEIEQDQAGGSESKPKNWSVSITISPPDLGTIHCKLTCYDGSVNSRFWSESADTVEKINGQLDYLKKQFELKGLVAGFMEAHQGKPIVTDSPKQPPASLLNVKA